MSKSASFINTQANNIFMQQKHHELQFNSPTESLIKSKLQENRSRNVCPSRATPFSASYLTNSQSVMSFSNLTLNNSGHVGSGRPIKGASQKNLNNESLDIYNSNSNLNRFDHQTSMPLSQSFQQLSNNLLLNKNQLTNSASSHNIMANSNSLLIPANSTMNIQNQIDLLNIYYQQSQQRQQQQLAEIEKLKLQLKYDKFIQN
jgi:hypothetical protein